MAAMRQKWHKLDITSDINLILIFFKASITYIITLNRDVHLDNNFPVITNLFILCFRLPSYITHGSPITKALPRSRHCVNDTP